MEIKQVPQYSLRHPTWPEGEATQCDCPYCGHSNKVQIGNVKEWGDDYSIGYCSKCDSDYTVVPIDGAVVGEKLACDAQNYLIKHHYDSGDQGVSVIAPDNLDVKRAAIYIQLKAEEWFGDEVSVSNLGIAAALVTFYGCKHARRNIRGNVIDMFHDPEEMCRIAWTSSSLNSLHRDGLREFISPHIVRE